ncbi:hypothetical protein GF361_05220 [Candidatus Woesearchaeota archaeon]|nr:hypothetical protein [Candidatus Woesearchaeota archaeon]
MKNKRFPTVAVILLAVGVFWLLSDLGVLVIDIPWWPIILIIVAIGWIFNSITKK